MKIVREHISFEKPESEKEFKDNLLSRKKFGKLFTLGNIDAGDLEDCKKSLNKIGVKYKINNNILWFYESQIKKLPEYKGERFIPCGDGTGFSFYEIKDL